MVVFSDKLYLISHTASPPNLISKENLHKETWLIVYQR